ncbi:hypothetical protein [Rhodococcus sp. NPDC058481]|uniref:hypothetical protein n=1 Tax=unclassified Rhodococcus (in: high G+C Gram-positive bacteria) TaxID=192944 RepID=UPI0036671807
MNTKRIFQVAITATAAAGIALVGAGVANAVFLTPPASKAACEAVLVGFKYPPSVTPTYANPDDVPMTAGFWTYRCEKLSDGRYSVVKNLASN